MCCPAVGFKRLVKDAGIERKVYNIDQISRLFNLTAGLKVKDPLPTPPTACVP
jgi:hypothetical protein